VVRGGKSVFGESLMSSPPELFRDAARRQ